jgi:hypothetical protein
MIYVGATQDTVASDISRETFQLRLQNLLKINDDPFKDEHVKLHSRPVCIPIFMCKSIRSIGVDWTCIHCRGKFFIQLQSPSTTPMLASLGIVDTALVQESLHCASGKSVLNDFRIRIARNSSLSSSI